MTKIQRLRELMRKRANKREDVPVEEVTAAVTDATTEVTGTIDGVLAAIDALLASPPESPDDWAAQVTAIREQVAALVPDVEDIVSAVDTVDPSGGDAAMQQGAERMTKALKDIAAKLSKAQERQAKRGELRNIAHQNNAALGGMRSATPPLPLINGGQTVEPTFKRTKRFRNDEQATKLGRMLQALNGNETARRWCDERGLMQRAASSSDYATGGILIPEDVEAEIVKFRDERGLARQICKVVPMGVASRTFRKQVDGPTVEYIGEGTPAAGITTSDNVRYSEHVLNTKWAAIGTEWYPLLDEDAAVSLADEFADWAGYAMAGAEDQAVFAGTGLSATGGIIGMPYAFRKAVEDAGGTWTTDAHKAYHPGLKVATGSTWASITLADITGMGANLAHRAGITRGYVCSSAFYYGKLLALAQAAGGIQPVNITDGVPQMMFNGFPVYITDYMPTATAVSDIPLLFGDFSSYYFGDRRGLTIESDKNIKTQLITTVATWRYGGMPFDFGTASSSAGSRLRGGIAALVTTNS